MFALVQQTLWRKKTLLKICWSPPYTRHFTALFQVSVELLFTTQIRLVISWKRIVLFSTCVALTIYMVRTKFGWQAVLNGSSKVLKCCSASLLCLCRHQNKYLFLSFSFFAEKRKKCFGIYIFTFKMTRRRHLFRRSLKSYLFASFSKFCVAGLAGWVLGNK
jgi:hypothetical protein